MNSGAPASGIATGAVGNDLMMSTKNNFNKDHDITNTTSTHGIDLSVQSVSTTNIPQSVTKSTTRLSVPAATEKHSGTVARAGYRRKLKRETNTTSVETGSHDDEEVITIS